VYTSHVPRRRARDGRCYCGRGVTDDKVDVIVELGRMSNNTDAKFSKVTVWLGAM